MHRIWVPLTMILTAMLLGCSHGGSGAPILPSSPDEFTSDGGIHTTSTVNPGNRHMLGFWTIEISADRSTVSIIPARTAEMHLNVIRLLEVNPCSNCLEISNIRLVERFVLEADVTITHPFPGLVQYTGFDVRGILISQSSYTFPASGREIAWGTDVPVVLNPDGYTALFNPTEFPETDPPALGYIEGKYSTGGDLTATLNPFLVYRKDAPRRMFEAGSSETRTIRLYVTPGPIRFGYAVDASWHPVSGEITDPLTDFPPDANCLEAYLIYVDFPDGINSSWMSQNAINVEVFDHQGLETIAGVTIEAPDIFPGEMPLTLSTQTGEDSWLFSGTVANENDAVHGTYPLVVKVTDTESDPNLGPVEGWTIAPAEVKSGWARTWGGMGEDEGLDVAIDEAGNVYTTGYFYYTVDFDPGSGVDERRGKGYLRAFVSKFDPEGTYSGVLYFGEDAIIAGQGIAVDASGNIYLTGQFWGTVDFDPGAGTDNHTSNGYRDAYVCKFDSTGNFVWARTWGGTENENYQDVSVDKSGNVYVLGVFSGTVDFDPGTGVDNHTSNGYYDVYVTKFDSTGAFEWALTWGGEKDDGFGDIGVDASGSAYVTGNFYDIVDFDPGPGVEYRESSSEYSNAFLSRFDSMGNLEWARTWGGNGTTESYGLAVDTSGNSYVTGRFTATTDFDPGPPMNNHEAVGWGDIYLSRFDPSGTLRWVRTWGGDDHEPFYAYGDKGIAVALDGSGNAFVTGFFLDTADFDPGSGVDNHTSNGALDAFISKFDNTGTFCWARTWGSGNWYYHDAGLGVAVDASGNSYVTGHFASTVDFDPSDGVDDHTSESDWDVFLVRFNPDGNW